MISVADFQHNFRFVFTSDSKEIVRIYRTCKDPIVIKGTYPILHKTDIEKRLNKCHICLNISFKGGQSLKTKQL